MQHIVNDDALANTRNGQTHFPVFRHHWRNVRDLCIKRLQQRLRYRSQIGSVHFSGAIFTN